jgi:hypothetical protein
VVGGWPPHNYFSELLFAGYIAVTSHLSWSCRIHQTTELLFQTYYCSDDRTFQANYDFGACSCALAAGPTLSLSLPRPRRLADVTPTVCTLGTDNRAHDSAVQMRQHLQSFLTGSVAALAFGYYRVHQDVWYAAEAVQQRR